MTEQANILQPPAQNSFLDVYKYSGQPQKCFHAMFVGGNRRWAPLTLSNTLLVASYALLVPIICTVLKYANSTCSHVSHIRFSFLAPSHPLHPLFFLEAGRDSNVLILIFLNLRTKSKILNQFEADQSQPFCLISGRCIYRNMYACK